MLFRSTHPRAPPYPASPRTRLIRAPLTSVPPLTRPVPGLGVLGLPGVLGWVGGPPCVSGSGRPPFPALRPADRTHLCCRAGPSPHVAVASPRPGPRSPAAGNNRRGARLLPRCRCWWAGLPSAPLARLRARAPNPTSERLGSARGRFLSFRGCCPGGSCPGAWVYKPFVPPDASAQNLGFGFVFMHFGLYSYSKSGNS